MINGSVLLIIIISIALLAVPMIIYFVLKPKKVIEKYESGELRKKYYLKKGFKVGVEKVYYRDKTLNKIKTFSNGKLNGHSLTYYPSGAIYIEANYQDDSLIGDYKIYEEDGTIKEIKKII